MDFFLKIILIDPKVLDVLRWLLRCPISNVFFYVFILIIYMSLV